MGLVPRSSASRRSINFVNTSWLCREVVYLLHVIYQHFVYMTKKETFIDFWKENKIPRDKPVFHPVLMQFAANFIGKTYEEFMRDHEVLVQSNLECQRFFDLDLVWLISDPYRETAAFGGQVFYNGNDSPRCQPILKLDEDLDKLPLPNVYEKERTRDRILGARLYKQKIGDELPVVGWVEGPLAEAADLAGIDSLMTYLMMEPQKVEKLMKRCLQTLKDFARAQIDEGVLIMGIGDAICSQIDPDTYGRYVLPLHQELVGCIHRQGACAKLHICGNIIHLLPHLKQVDMDILDLDWMVDMDQARETLGPDVILCGNLDPVRVVQELPVDELEKVTLEFISGRENERFILSGGCEITSMTPFQNLKVMGKIEF